ncbi:MAG: VOC family protein [Acidobacteria bacterium]|nr:VOC family protein [Acidobacteriota bacterium]
MVRNGLDRIQISVSDMAASVAFFRDMLDMRVVNEETIDATAFQRLWRLPAGTTARAAYLRNDEQSTAIELVEVRPHSGKYIREGARMYDHGLLDIAFRAKHLDAIHADLTARGTRFHSAPVVYTADWAHVTVSEVVMIGPDLMPVALIERLSEPKPFIKNRFGTMVDVAQYVHDMDACTPFYTDILGYTSVFNQPLPDGLIDDVVGLPPGSHSRLNLMYQLETKTPAVELIHCSSPGRSLAPVIGPASYGLFALAFEAVDLPALLDRVRQAGFEVLAGPLDMASGLHGRVTAATVRGPNDVLIEFFGR